jgi:hypothetical protein
VRARRGVAAAAGTGLVALTGVFAFTDHSASAHHSTAPATGETTTEVPVPTAPTFPRDGGRPAWPDTGRSGTGGVQDRATVPDTSPSTTSRSS